jgi:hypothetical protein
LDRIGVARMARSAGLPPLLAERVAEVVVDAGLPEDRRAEVFRELVAHFDDGLAAGRSAEELLAGFGDGARAGRLIGRHKRAVTPPASGGTGRADGPVRRLARDARSGLIRGLLVGVAPLDPVTFALVPLALVAVASVAALVPARRAGRVDPVAALRSE